MNIDQRIRMLIGEYVIQNMALLIENEQLKVRIAALTPPAHEPEPATDPDKA